jgi:hypothetical protein
MSEIIVLGPVAYNPMGSYNSETEYERLDVVLYNGVSYVAKQDVQGQIPTNTDYWDQLGISGADMANYYTKTETNSLLNNKEDNTNKVTAISSTSTDEQYPSAKCVYDIVGNISSILDTLNGEVI